MSWLETAKDITSGERRRDYGHPLTNFLRICLMWSTILGQIVTPRTFVHLMVTMKVARDMNTYKEDNHVDTIGYEMGLEACFERMQVLGYTSEDFENPDYGYHNMQRALRKSEQMDREGWQE